MRRSVAVIIILFWINTSFSQRVVHINSEIQYKTHYDDLNLDFGKSRIRPSGKDGGHNGLKSIIEKINTENFIRLRFGIGNNFQTGKQIDYVLGKWSSIEKNSLEDLISNNSEMILHIVKHGVENTMNKYN